MSTYSPTLYHGGEGGSTAGASSSSQTAVINQETLSSGGDSSPIRGHSPQASLGLFSKLRRFAKSKPVSSKSSGYPYNRGFQKGDPCIHSEPPSFTGYSTDQSSSPKVSRPESSSGFYHSAAQNVSSAVASPNSSQIAFASSGLQKSQAAWRPVSGGAVGCWACIGKDPQIQLKEVSMLVLTEFEKKCLRDVALSTLLDDTEMRKKMVMYIERNNHTEEPKQHRSALDLSKFFSRLSRLRFSTGSYSTSNPPVRRSKNPRTKVFSGFRKQQMPDASRVASVKSSSAATSAPSLVFGATLKRCLANEILAERKKLMRLERQSRNGTNRFVSRKFEPLSSPDGAEVPSTTVTPMPGDQRLFDGQVKELGDTGGDSKKHLSLNRRSSVNGVLSSKTCSKTWPNNLRCNNNASPKHGGNQVLNSEQRENLINELVTDDADSGFQDDTEQPSMKATSFDTGRRFERFEAYGSMPLQVPQFVRKCVRHIETYGLDVEGIFRLGTSKKRIRAQIAEIQRFADFNFTPEHSVHDTAALLKEYFRDLPEPLLTRALYPAFVALGAMPNKHRALYLLKLLVLLLPSVHRDTLYFLLVFLRQVASHASSNQGGNKMTSHNLATLFGPNILRFAPTAHQETAPVLQESASAALKSLDAHEFIVEAKDRAEERLAIIEVVTLLIDNYDTIFQIPVDMVDQMFVKMLPDDCYSASSRNNASALTKGKCRVTPPLETMQRLLLKRAGCRLQPADETDNNCNQNDSGMSPAINTNNDYTCSTPTLHYGTQTGSLHLCLENSNIAPSTELSAQSSPSVASAKAKKEGNDEGAVLCQSRPELTAESSMYPNVTASFSRSEGDLTSGHSAALLQEISDPVYYRLTGRPRPKRYGESYAARIRIPDELIHAASTWEELRNVLETSPSDSTLPRITVTVAAPSSAPDTPVPSQQTRA